MVVIILRNKSELVNLSLPFAKLIPIFDKAQQIFQSNNSSMFVSILPGI
jgi:hypothetical protein